MDPDEEFQRIVEESGDNPSKPTNKWALNWFQKWQAARGFNMSKPLEEMDPVEAVKLLCLFFQQVAKENRELYPPGSLHNLFSAFQCILRRAQECRIMETGMNENPFNMRTDPQFCRVVLACILAMRRSRKPMLKL
jgi:hypothetical protein